MGGGWSAAGALSADRVRTKFPALILYLIIGNTVDFLFRLKNAQNSHEYLCLGKKKRPFSIQKKGLQLFAIHDNI